jgi:hypothetical protein
MRMAMLIAAAEEPGGGDVHAKTSRGNQNRLVEMDTTGAKRRVAAS